MQLTKNDSLILSEYVKQTQLLYLMYNLQTAIVTMVIYWDINKRFHSFLWVVRSNFSEERPRYNKVYCDFTQDIVFLFGLASPLLGLWTCRENSYKCGVSLYVHWSNTDVLPSISETFPMFIFSNTSLSFCLQTNTR